MSSLYDLLTQASIKLGGEPITSLTADTVETEVWAAIWEPVLLRALSSNTWNFATGTQELSRLLDAPADPRYQYQFDLPSDFLTARFFMDSAGTKTESYTVEGSRLFSNFDRVIAKYGKTYGEDDIADLPSWFCDFYVSSLANEACERLVGIGSVKQAIDGETQRLHQKAKVRDAQLVPSVRIDHSVWRSAR